MYLKLMVRSLLRHQKRGRRLFVLLALCSAALVALLTFQADFADQYRDLFIGMKTGHLQVLPRDAAAFATNPWGSRTQDVPLMTVTPAFDSWVRAQAEVAEASPFLARQGLAYNLDGEYDSWFSMNAVPADRLSRLLPLVRPLEGTADLAWKPGDPEVPVLKSRLQTEFGQKNPDTTRFVRDQLRVRGQGEMEDFKRRLAADWPSVFGGRDFAGPGNDEAFFQAWAAALPDRNLKDRIPKARLEAYDYRIDDAVTAIAENQAGALVTFLNQRLFQALYPEDIGWLGQPIVAGKSVTLMIPGVRSEGALAMPKILPARYAAMGEILPLYTPESWMDLGALGSYLEVAPGQAMGYMIRLHRLEDLEPFRARLEAWIAAHGAENGLTENGQPLVRTADYRFLGKMFLATSTAFSVILAILIAVFVLILVIFIVNLVLMSMIQRRREIGTGIAMGLTNGQTILVMTGEIGVIVTVSWAAGALLGFALVAAGAAWGVPGMIFFPGQRLFLTPQALPYLWSYLILLPSALLAAFIPLTGLRQLLPVDFFREAR